MHPLLPPPTDVHIARCVSRHLLWHSWQKNLCLPDRQASIVRLSCDTSRLHRAQRNVAGGFALKTDLIKVFDQVCSFALYPIYPCPELLIVFMLAVMSLMSSVQSAQSESNAGDGAAILLSRRSSSQYSVSAVSLSAIWSFDPKSVSLCAWRLSAIFAPIDVPDRSFCFAMTDSLRSRRYLYRRTII